MIAVLLVSAILAAILGKLISAILLGWINRVGGAILGIVVGAFFWAAILSMWVHYLGPGDAVSHSALARFLLDTFPFVLGLLPSEFDSVRNFFS
jgi:membrane protein required for colicin V production